MKKQLLLVAALLFTVTAYSQIHPNHGTRVRTAARTGTESDRPDISTVAADGSQSPAKARGGKTERMTGKEGCSPSGKTRGAGMNGGVKTGVRPNSGTGSKLSRPNIGINNRVNAGARNL
jgi:hypothetical protein